MPDQITPTERALIEKAIAAGRVTRLPPGAFSENMGGGVHWRDQARAARTAQARGQRLAATEPKAEERPRRGPTPEVAHRRRRILALADGTRTAPQIAAALKAEGIHVSASLIGVDISQLRKDGHQPKMTEGGPGNRRQKNIAAQRRRQVLEMLQAGQHKRQAAAALGVSLATIENDLTALRKAGEDVPVHRLRSPSSGGDKAAQKKAERAERAIEEVKDRRRFKQAPVAMGRPAKLAPASATGTLFPTRVFEPTDAEPVLKDGSSNSKIGGDVLVGWLRGARIVTLTLEERATCPRSCPIWTGCYGNTSQHYRRWRHGPALEARIVDEITTLCATHEKVLVRLHVLGDFYSANYARLWSSLLRSLPGLAVFGFTAHRPDSEIGSIIGHMRDEFGMRCAIRHSGMTGRWGSFTIDFQTRKKRIGDAIVCPEQRDAYEGLGRSRHCGNCAVCWSSDAPIAFVEH